MAKMSQSLWVEKYRPQKVSHIVMPNDFKSFFNRIVETGDCPNLLLSSPIPGTGKTAISKAIINDLQADSVYINASSEGGIDTLRTKISEFAMCKSFTGKPKIVILDEADGLTPQFQGALRGFIEQYANTCRFILTCNNINKIIKPLQEGRTMVWDFNMSKPEYKKELLLSMNQRICGILKSEKIEYDENVIPKLIESCYPSMRTIIAVLQKYAETYGRIDESVMKFSNFDDTLWNLIKEKNLTNARAYITEMGYAPSDVFIYLFNYVVPKLKKAGDAIMTISEYEYRCAFSSAPEIQISACLLELIRLVKDGVNE